MVSSRLLFDFSSIPRRRYVCNNMASLSLPSASASIVITADESMRGGKKIPLKATVDEAVERVECVRKVFVSKRTGADVPFNERDIPLEEVRACRRDRNCRCPFLFYAP